MKTEEYLKVHKNKYEMMPQDEIKLLFQAHFGGGHFVPSNDKALDFVKNEINNITPSEYSDYPLYEKVSDDYSRLHLIKTKELGLSENTVSKLFVLSAKDFSNTQEFEKDIKKLVNKDYVEKYLIDGIRPISHSEKYKSKYCPHYRVISNFYLKYLPLLSKIDRELKNKSRLIIGIDGKAGSGKTTLANTLFDIYGVSIIKADDFFVPICQKTKERESEIGGNIDYKRMKKEVFDNITKSVLSYRQFSCQTQQLLTPKTVDLSKITVIEGSYSSHPYFNYKYDISVFCDIDEKTQKERIKNRNGDFSKRFFEEFIPKENLFFEKYSTKENADIVIE